MPNLYDIFFNVDFWGSLLLGYPLNIILIILIIFKTPKEMETHSRILIQNCVLDILGLISQMFDQMFYIIDDNGYSAFIFTNGILFEYMTNNFNKIICQSFIIIGQFFFIINLYGLCAQFIYRYLILNRNMKPNFKRYLYMFSIVLIIGLFYNLIIIFYVMQYIGGGIKQFDAEYLNKTLPFVITKSEDLSSLIMTLIAILPFIIIFICGFKMVYYVNLHTGFDQNMKRLLKQLTKTLILLAIIPSINQFLTLLAVFLGFIYKTNDSTKENINILIYLW
uniref:G-protein coupled receptors family 1 profile domain-containing protein n=1 Tax=Meloidogyne enterolobii TaxID=390850 RepID=A0A6V7URZ7_MELEN|nr:unnamed protein product [Meloidogyne enterolobii]